MESNIFDKHIHEKLKKIFLIRFGIDLDFIAKDNFDKHLLGKEFTLAPRDLVYLYIDIKKEFGISLSDEDVAVGGFSTMNNIIKLIYRELLQHEKVVVEI